MSYKNLCFDGEKDIDTLADYAGDLSSETLVSPMIQALNFQGWFNAMARIWFKLSSNTFFMKMSHLRFLLIVITILP